MNSERIGIFFKGVKRWKHNKGAWGMPWLSTTTKDVVSCEKRWGGANDRYIHRCPNGVTRTVEDRETMSTTR